MYESVELLFGIQFKWYFNKEETISSVRMSQQICTEGILRRFRIYSGKAASTPIIECLFTELESQTDISVLDCKYYHSMIGSLLNISLHTRLDVRAFLLLLASVEKFSILYYHRVVKRILGYLRGTTYYVLTMVTLDLGVNYFVDADYSGYKSDRKSRSGFIIKSVYDTCVLGSKTQTIVALYTCE